MSTQSGSLKSYLFQVIGLCDCHHDNIICTWWVLHCNKVYFRSVVVKVKFKIKRKGNGMRKRLLWSLLSCSLLPCLIEPSFLFFVIGSVKFPSHDSCHSQVLPVLYQRLQDDLLAEAQGNRNVGRAHADRSWQADWGQYKRGSALRGARS